MTESEKKEQQPQPKQQIKPKKGFAVNPPKNPFTKNRNVIPLGRRGKGGGR